MAILISQKISFEFLSETKDREGRYILIQANIEGVRMTLLNIYATPGSDLPFYRKIFDLMTEGEGTVICGGDWNMRLNPKLDSSKDSPQASLQRKLKTYMLEMGIIVLWRSLHPTKKDYTHYSHPHATYARIDSFFIKKRSS